MNLLFPASQTRIPLSMKLLVPAFLPLLSLFALPPSAAQDPLDPFADLTAAAESGPVITSEVDAIVPGEPLTLAVTLPHPEGWHSYYLNSGGVELPPTLTWTLPDGFTAGPIQWPVPEVLPSDFGKSLAYKESLTLLVELTPPASLATGTTLTLSTAATWQYCQPGKCINKEATLSLDLPVAAENSPIPEHTALFAKVRASHPVATAAWTFSASRQGDAATLRITPGPGAATPTELTFIPDQPFIAPADFTTAEADGDTLVLQLRQAVDLLQEPVPFGDSISGILVAKHSWLDSATVPAIVVPEISFAAPESAAAAPATATASRGFFFIFGGMFLGGLILNLMPCVFPVIGIKIMGFVQQAGHDRRKIVIHGIIFAAGVLISFWLLALALFLGGITNWGNQLQDPRVIFVTILIMLLLGMNLFGVFEIGTSATAVGGKLQSKQGVSGTFFSGVLATIVATPCSGPFLGVAIGAAATLPAVPFFLAFTAMALGLALPYLVLSIFPDLVKRLPRPGPWMESFKQGMSFLLFATAGVFLWVYSSQVFDRNAGQKGLYVMIGLTAVATAAWIYGRWNQPFRATATRHAAKLAALLLLGSGVAAAWPWSPPVTPQGQGSAQLEWLPWSARETDRLLAAGSPVFIDFTAKWCLTCQLNKSRAYTPEVIALMREKGIVALRADKTNPDPAIEAELRALGRTAIPVNVLHVPGRDLVITPELLSPAYLLDLFRDVPSPGS